MSLPAFLSELEKIAAGPPSPSKPVPINAVAPKGPSVPHPGGLKPPPLPPGAGGGFGALMQGLAGAKGNNPLAKMKLAMKLAALNATTVLPGATAKAKAIGSGFFPKAKSLPVGAIPRESVALAMFGGAGKGPSLPSKPPPSARVTPATGPTTNTIPSPAQADGGFTIPAPARMPKFAFAGPTGAPPVAAPGAAPAPKPVTPASGRAYAAMRGVLAGPKKPPMTMKIGEDQNPPHGHPGHNHTSAVEKLRAVVKAKHPHLVKDKAASVADYMGRALGTESRIGKHLVDHAHGYDLAGLGILAAPAAHNLGHQAVNAASGKDVDKTEAAHAGLEIAGLGTLAAPIAFKAMHGLH